MNTNEQDNAWGLAERIVNALERISQELEELADTMEKQRLDKT